MNATATRKTVTLNLVGAAIVTAALAVGAGFGSLTSPDAPAYAIPTDDRTTCSLVCAQTVSGGRGGDNPGLLPGSGGSGGNVGTVGGKNR